MGDVSTYETIASAKNKEGKFVTLIVKLSPNSLVYNPKTNPNFVSFVGIDSLHDSILVHYYFEKPYDMEKSSRIVLKGKVINNVFEIKSQDGILIKCPSKYKDDPTKASQQLSGDSM